MTKFDKSPTEVAVDVDTKDVCDGKRPRTYEELLGLLGASGPYQLLVLGCLSLVKAFPGMVTLSHSFARPTLMAITCDINSTLQAASSVSPECWDTAEATKDQCRVRFNCSSAASIELPCHDWHFDRTAFTETIASRFRLVCSDSHLADLAATCYFAGFLVGASLYGIFADRFGRLPSCLVGMMNLSLMTALAALAPVYWLYALAMLLAGIGNGGLLTVLYTAAVEVTSASYRLIYGFAINQGWTIGMLALVLAAYLERNYQALLLWLCATSLPLGLLIFLVGESPRWLITTGRVDRADAVIARMARLNGTTDKLPEGFSAAEIKAISDKATEAANNKSGIKSPSLLDLFRTPGLRMATLLSWLHWFAVAMTYYGINLGAGSIGGDIFINIALVTAVEFPARFIAMGLNACQIGRKPVLYVSFGLSAIFLAAMVGVYDQSAAGTAAANVALAVMSKLSITIAFDGVWLYYSELFPTVLRSAGVGSGSTVARAGAMLSTQLLPLRSIWGPLPFVIFGTGPLLACLVIYFLPETVGRALPETVADAEAFVRPKDAQKGCCSRRTATVKVTGSESVDIGETKI